MQKSAALSNSNSRLFQTEIKKVIPCIKQNTQKSQDQCNQICHYNVRCHYSENHKTQMKEVKVERWKTTVFMDLKNQYY